MVVGSDRNVRLLKGEGHPLQGEDERRYMVGSMKPVYRCLVSTGSGWMDAEPEIDRLRPTYYVVNEDGDKPERPRSNDAKTAPPAAKSDGRPATEQLEKTNDPVRMYLREMGTVPLLDREGEVEIAQRIENGEWTIYEALCSNPVALRELLRLNEAAQKDRRILGQLISGDPSEHLDAKATDRIGRNLETFERISALDKEIRGLRLEQQGVDSKDPSYQEKEREIDRLLGKIAKDIRSIDFTVQTRNQLVELLRDIHKEFSRLRNDLRRAKKALEKESNRELRALQERRMKKYRARLRALEDRYGTAVTHHILSVLVQAIRTPQAEAAARAGAQQHRGGEATAHQPPGPPAAPQQRPGRGRRRTGGAMNRILSDSPAAPADAGARGRVRRAKLYYLRGLTGKAARIKEKVGSN